MNAFARLDFLVMIASLTSMIVYQTLAETMETVTTESTIFHANVDQTFTAEGANLNLMNVRVYHVRLTQPVLLASELTSAFAAQEKRAQNATTTSTNVQAILVKTTVSVKMVKTNIFASATIRRSKERTVKPSRTNVSRVLVTIMRFVTMGLGSLSVNAQVGIREICVKLKLVLVQRIHVVSSGIALIYRRLILGNVIVTGIILGKGAMLR